MTDATGHRSTPSKAVGARSRDASVARELQVARLRAMTATEKVAIMHSLHRQAWALKRAGLRAQHADWTDSQVEARVRELFLQQEP